MLLSAATTSLARRPDESQAVTLTVILADKHNYSGRRAMFTRRHLVPHLISPFSVEESGETSFCIRNADGYAVCWTTERSLALLVAALLEALAE